MYTLKPWVLVIKWVDLHLLLDYNTRIVFFCHLLAVLKVPRIYKVLLLVIWDILFLCDCEALLVLKCKHNDFVSAFLASENYVKLQLFDLLLVLRYLHLLLLFTAFNMD
jgi:hypothetical protein